MEAAHDTETKRRVLMVAILGAGIVFLDTSVANVALPAIQRDLGLSTAMQQWVVSGYMLTLSVLLLVGGRLADLFGRRLAFITGLAAYSALAVVAGLAPTGLVLVGARTAQGIAGALLVPTTLAIINATYPPSERGAAIGTWAAWSGISTILGPVLGGMVIDNLTWRYAFFISPALAVMALALALRIPESSDESAVRSIDYGGVLLVVAAFGGIVFALIQGPVAGWGATEVVWSAVLGVAMLPVLALYEWRRRDPIVPLGMFANRNLSAANVVTFFVYAGLYGMFFYVSIYTQTALGASATLAGFLFVPVTVALFFLSPLAGRLNDRYGPRWLLCFGPAVASAGLVISAMTRPGQLWTVLVPGIVVFGIGLGFTVAPVTATAIGSAEERYSGSASGFNNAVSRIAGLLAIALMGVIVVQLWQASLSTAAQGAAPEVRDALETVTTQAFVTPDTGGLTGPQATELERVTDEASSTSFRNGMLLAALLVAAGGIVSAGWVRNDPGHET